jgi:hypothetical protein
MLVCSATSTSTSDISSVFFRGDCTEFGMKVEDSYFADGCFLIVTTGARFEYTLGKMKIYQGLSTDIGSKRLVATVTIEGAGNAEKVEANNDHVLLRCGNLGIGIYGDSTCIIAPKEQISVKVTGDFKPDYEGRYNGELLLIDNAGGVEIYPQRYEAGYKVKTIDLGKKHWVAEYLLSAGERVMIAAFPGRKFDWEKSFRTHFTVTTGQGNAKLYPYGQMPPDNTIKRWSMYLDIIAVQYNGLWASGETYGPYIVLNKPEVRRMINTAHKNGMKVIAHCSLFYWKLADKDIESFYEQIKDVKDTYNTDGVYIDGLLFDWGGHKIDDKIVNWETIRRLRQLFGKDGIIIYHGTSLGSPVATVPNIDSYCDATLNGEGVAFQSLDDPYIKYQVRKYGISNTVGLWITDKKPRSITETEIIDKLIEMNCRKWWNGYAFGQDFDSNFLYYLKKLAVLKQSYLEHDRP